MTTTTIVDEVSELRASDFCEPGIRCTKTADCTMAMHHVPPCNVRSPCTICGRAAWEECDVVIEKGPELKPIRLSPWTIYQGHCAMRFVEGTDPNDIANRIAFIEKTSRIRIFSFDHDPDNDHRNWKQGPKGRACSCDEDAERHEAYGFYPPSRAWCDRELLKLGYVLPDRCIVEDDQ